MIEEPIVVRSPKAKSPLKKAILPLAIVAMALVVAGVYQASEISAVNYRTLRNGFKDGSPAYRMAVAVAMRSGEVNRWEYTGLLRQHGQENKVLAVESTATNLAEERLVLAAMTRQVKAP